MKLHVARTNIIIQNLKVMINIIVAELGTVFDKKDFMDSLDHWSTCFISARMQTYAYQHIVD